MCFFSRNAFSISSSETLPIRKRSGLDTLRISCRTDSISACSTRSAFIPRGPIVRSARFQHLVRSPDLVKMSRYPFLAEYRPFTSWSYGSLSIILSSWGPIIYANTRPCWWPWMSRSKCVAWVIRYWFGTTPSRIRGRILMRGRSSDCTRDSFTVA